MVQRDKLWHALVSLLLVWVSYGFLLAINHFFCRQLTRRRTTLHSDSTSTDRDNDSDNNAMIDEENEDGNEQAEEHNQGFGDRPGDQGRALKAEVSRLNGELDESRSKVALLEAELEEKKKIETLLRQEIDRLRRSA